MIKVSAKHFYNWHENRLHENTASSAFIPRNRGTLLFREFSPQLAEDQNPISNDERIFIRGSECEKIVHDKRKPDIDVASFQNV